MRLFIAVPLPREVADRAAACLPPALPAVKPVRSDLLHVTLAFVGWVADERLAEVIAAARAAAAGQPPFEVSFDRAGRFPAAGRPRTIWLGAGAGADELARLAADAAHELRARSFVLDDRPFTAHLTLARVRNDASGPESQTVAATVDALAVRELRVPVDRIAVVESRLSPRGPAYTNREEVRLP